jgi:hypothetical protein
MNAKSYALSRVSSPVSNSMKSVPKPSKLVAQKPDWTEPVEGFGSGQDTRNLTEKTLLNNTCFHDPKKGFFWVDIEPNGTFHKEPYTQGTTCSREEDEEGTNAKKVPRGQ